MVPSPRAPHPADAYTAHFLGQTWLLQGPDWLANIRGNMHRFTRETMWNSLPSLGTFPPSPKVLVLGAGPSLEENLHVLRSWKGPTIVTGHALQWVRNDLKDVQCVTVLEATLETVGDMDLWWKDVDTSRYPLVTVPYADDLLFERWKGPVKFLNTAFAFPELQRLAVKIQARTRCGALMTGSNVGVMSLVLAFNIGAKDIALVGYDSCVYEEPPKEDPSLQTMDVRGRECWVPWAYYVGCHELRVLARDMKARFHVRVVNASEAGVAYAGMERMPLEEWIEARVEQPQEVNHG